MTITLLLTSLAILAASVLGGIVPLATVLNHTRLQVYLSLSAGAMLGAAFFHMLPEAVRVGSAATIPWVTTGLLAVFFLERFFSFHQHEPRDVEAAEHEHLAREHHHQCSDHSPGTVAPALSHHSPARSFSWGSAAFGLAIHSIVGGVALASAVVADF